MADSAELKRHWLSRCGGTLVRQGETVLFSPFTYTCAEATAFERNRGDFRDLTGKADAIMNVLGSSTGGIGSAFITSVKPNKVKGEAGKVTLDGVLESKGWSLPSGGLRSVLEDCHLCTSPRYKCWCPTCDGCLYDCDCFIEVLSDEPACRHYNVCYQCGECALSCGCFQAATCVCNEYPGEPTELDRQSPLYEGYDIDSGHT